MASPEFQKIISLDGLPFIKALLDFEAKRFDEAFLKSSVFEDINANFGIFPAQKMYPLYFMGDVREPKDKIIFVGINPGFHKERNQEEQEYLERVGSFEGYCTRFRYRGQFKRHSVYFANIGGFLRRIGLLDQKITWEWLQDHFINMDLIPYHSSNAAGIRINDLPYYKDRYFVPFVKIIQYLDPQEPVFIVGFPTFEKYLSDPMFSGLIDFEKHEGIWVGTIGNKYKFFGLPFLSRVAGGKDKLVEVVKRYM